MRCCGPASSSSSEGYGDAEADGQRVPAAVSRSADAVLTLPNALRTLLSEPPLPRLVTAVCSDERAEVSAPI
jgi:hypothetical protein